MEERVLRELAELVELRRKFRDQVQAIENQMMVLQRVLKPEQAPDTPDAPTDESPLPESGE